MEHEQKGPAALKLSDYLKVPRGDQPWLLESLLPVGGKMLIYSQPKLGKSSIAIQLAHALSGGAPDWMGFQVRTTGKVFYLQLDTPPSTWAERFKKLAAHGITLNDNIILADSATFGQYHFPFDILQPSHMEFLATVVKPFRPAVVIIDTLRKAHSGEENSSTAMAGVLNNFQQAIEPAALVLISHDKKPSPDGEKDILYDHRGSGGVVGEMDAIVRLTKTRLWYAGRDIEQDSIRITKQEYDDVLLWMPDPNEFGKVIETVMEDSTLHPDGKLWTATRARARALSSMVPGKSEDGAMSALRRAAAKHRAGVKVVPKAPPEGMRFQPADLGSILFAGEKAHDHQESPEKTGHPTVG